MDLYQVALWVHRLSALGLVVALAVEAVAYVRFRRAATADEIHRRADRLRRTVRWGPVAMVPLLVAGIWMMVDRWGAEPWILTALAGIALMAALAGVVTRRSMRRLRWSLATGTGPSREGVGAIIRALSVSLWLRVGLVVGILALMTTKPGAAGSIGDLALASSIGISVAIGESRAGRVRVDRRAHTAF